MQDILLVTMINGAAVMDAALLLIAANEVCPQPQTSEHLAIMEIMRMQNIIISRFFFIYVNKVIFVLCIIYYYFRF